MKSLARLMVLVMLVATVGLFGCADDGSNGAAGMSAYDIAVANGFAGTETEWLASLDPSNPMTAAASVEPESCATCHNGTVVRSGDTHQAAYDELFQHNVVVVSDLAYATDGANDTVTFEMTKSGAAFDCTQADSLNIYYTQYTGPTFDVGRYSLKGTVSYDAGTNVCTSTKAVGTYGDLSATNGIIVVYGNDELVESISSAHISLAKYPFAALLKLGTVDYVSVANATGCEKCHTTPYYKHGYIIGDIGQGVGDLDFYSCKACHLDQGAGGHTDWQRMVDDPMGWALGTAQTPEQDARYAYKTKLMNDVHMSHAMEFPYPQSMANCATCHAGKLAETLTDANFNAVTCKSCHPVVGGTDTANANGQFAVDTTGLALNTLIPHGWSEATDCSACHMTGGIAPTFSEIHTGYDAKIYDTAGNKYADGITASVDTVTFDGTTLDISFSATGTVGGLDAANIVPTVMVSFYGYDTKDFIVSNHSRDDNNQRMEFTTTAADNALFTQVATGVAGTWEVMLDLSAYATTPSILDRIADGSVKRAEIAVMPALENADGVTVGLNAPSMTFDLAANAFETDYYSGTNAIVDVTNGCNTCHDQLATTFHSGNRGGNIVVCRMCHVVTSGGSHLAGQSRSIDSYAHAIHSFQAFDVDNIDFTDPVEAAHYEEHINFLFPNFATINCEACHNAGKYNVPSQAKSMPGVLSATDEVPGMSIGVTPSVVTGPAARACGGCHRAVKINEDDAGGLASFNSHTKTFGYRIENETGVLDTVINTIMAMFQ